ncbi:hypothetical protein J2X19_000521 [Rhodoferax ferrireducens]|uniref:Uncharacterized protein n=1 Tax=Rhodoferax ferrireducens TaxID=192843 RepID=A0ABU2C3H9_9BURK|nr:hypothetical protein [Rhodoferax ferrireducens]MDR7375863.1 hypothetical protein [Rhodoferax ferrireducens]
MLIQEARIHLIRKPVAPALSDVACEHAALVRMLAGAQARVSVLVSDHAQQIAALQAQIVRLRGRAILRDTMLAWLRESLARLEPEAAEDLAPHADAADRVICQTGCVSHGNYWRDDDQCRRTGKSCTMDGVKVEIPR